MNYEENVRAILQACFSQSKDELIETAVKAIVSLKQEPIVINPIDPNPFKPCPMPYYTPNIPTTPLTPTIAPGVITCENSTNSEN